MTLIAVLLRVDRFHLAHTPTRDLADLRRQQNQGS